SNSRFDPASTCFALWMRFPIAACLLTKAPATSSMLKPQRMWRINATCASSDSRGWQHENIMRSRSSLIASGAKSCSTTGATVHSPSSSRPSSGANVRAVRWRRSTSSARFFAVAISHADGLSGMPRNFHTSTARQKASCTTSSASARLWTPKIRVRAATMRPASRRNRWSLGAMLHIQNPDRAYFHRAAGLQNRTALGEFHRRGQVIGLDQGEAVHDVLGLGIGTVVHALLLASDHLAGGLQRVARIFDMALLAEFLEPGDPFLGGLLHLLGGCGNVPAAEQEGKFAHCRCSFG